MLAAVTEVLDERQLLVAGEEPDYNITLVDEDVVNIDAFTRDGAFYRVRVKQYGVLPTEYEHHCKAWQAYPQYVPEPLGKSIRQDWEIFVLRGIRHRHVAPGEIGQDKHGLIRGLNDFFFASAQSGRVATPVEPHRAMLRQLQDRVADSTLAAIVAAWLSTDTLDGLPHIKQHGDFVVNNLGRCGHGLTVFDWEDFGRVTFPGLDLCTVLASDALFDACVMRAISDGKGHRQKGYQQLVEAGCPVLGLTPGLFRRLIPLYLVMFLDLKKDYGKAIGRLVSELIHDI